MLALERLASVARDELSNIAIEFKGRFTGACRPPAYSRRHGPIPNSPFELRASNIAGRGGLFWRKRSTLSAQLQYHSIPGVEQRTDDSTSSMYCRLY